MVSPYKPPRPPSTAPSPGSSGLPQQLQGASPNVTGIAGGDGAAQTEDVVVPGVAKDHDNGNDDHGRVGR